MMEVDRVLRPGGYWVLSGPPINWKANYKSWLRPKEELEEEQRKIEETAKQLCWEKRSEKAEMAIWQKVVDSESCQRRKDDSSVEFCESSDADDVWYVCSLISYIILHFNGLLLILPLFVSTSHENKHICIFLYNCIHEN